MCNLFIPRWDKARKHHRDEMGGWHFLLFFELEFSLTEKFFFGLILDAPMLLVLFYPERVLLRKGRTKISPRLNSSATKTNGWPGFVIIVFRTHRQVSFHHFYTCGTSQPAGHLSTRVRRCVIGVFLCKEKSWGFAMDIGELGLAPPFCLILLCVWLRIYRHAGVVHNHWFESIWWYEPS